MASTETARPDKAAGERNVLEHFHVGLHLVRAVLEAV
jgi:hypothetical protein